MRGHESCDKLVVSEALTIGPSAQLKVEKRNGSTQRVSLGSQELTASGSVVAGTQGVELNHATVAVAATIANAANHQGFFIVKNTSASGTAAHTLVLTSGTFDGTNDTATLNAPNEALVVYFDSAGNGTIVENVGSVALS